MGLREGITETVDKWITPLAGEKKQIKSTENQYNQADGRKSYVNEISTTVRDNFSPIGCG